METLYRLLFSIGGQINRLQFIGGHICLWIGIGMMEAAASFLASMHVKSPMLPFYNLSIPVYWYLAAAIYLWTWFTLHVKRYCNMGMHAGLAVSLFIASLICLLILIVFPEILLEPEFGKPNPLIDYYDNIINIALIICALFYYVIPAFWPPQKNRYYI